MRQLLRLDKKDASEDVMAAAADGLVLEGDRLLVHGEDVTDDIRTPEVTGEVSRVSAVPQVRRVVQGKQRALRGRLVAEGRQHALLDEGHHDRGLLGAEEERALGLAEGQPLGDGLGVEELVGGLPGPLGLLEVNA